MWSFSMPHNIYTRSRPSGTHTCSVWCVFVCVTDHDVNMSVLPHFPCDRKYYTPMHSSAKANLFAGTGLDRRPAHPPLLRRHISSISCSVVHSKLYTYTTIQSEHARVRVHLPVARALHTLHTLPTCTYYIVRKVPGNIMKTRTVST